MSVQFSMAERLEWSRGQRQETDRLTLLQLIPDCVKVDDTQEAMDRAGVDYIARLTSGVEILIDAKNRDVGCSKFWKYDEPEVALESWSVMPGGSCKQKRGWTLNKSSPVQYIFFKFDPSDTNQVYLMPFQLLRKAFLENGEHWFTCGKYKVDIQNTCKDDGCQWQSKAVFVPVSKVEEALLRAQRGTRSDTPKHIKPTRMFLNGDPTKPYVLTSPEDQPF